MRKVLSSILVILVSAAAMIQATSAAFEETVLVAGTTFSVASSFEEGAPDQNTTLKLLSDPALTPTEDNTVDAIPGMSFENITPSWVDTTPIKIYNKGTQTLDLIASAEYISDPDTLRDDIYVEIAVWNDDNSNGVVDPGEEGDSYGYDTILRMKNDTFPLGEIAPGETLGLIMRFDGTGISEYNVDQSAVYNFTFTGIGQ